MKNLVQGMLAGALILSLPALACTPDAKEGFVPENNLRIDVHAKRLGGLTEQQFNAVIDRVENVYKPIVKEAGGKLIVMRDWEDPTVNAYAERLGDNWRVRMFGGLARHEAITEDGMALVVCHEIGHHVGGAPRKTSPWASPWASNEGQADYFANLKCLRRVWVNDNNEEIVSKMDVPKALAEACGQKHVFNADVAVCIRGGMAGLSVATLFQALRKNPVAPRFDTPDTSVVEQTDDAHPAYQCRLDTYFQGSLCDVPMDEPVSEVDEVPGTCHAANGHTLGLRPLCWFKPSVE